MTLAVAANAFTTRLFVSVSPGMTIMSPASAGIVSSTRSSGAAVPPAEYENDRRTNFRIAGDAPDIVKQKRGSRVQTMRGIGNSAGRALQEFYGQDASLDSLLGEFADAEMAPLHRPIPGLPGAIAESTDGGKTWKRVK